MAHLTKSFEQVARLEPIVRKDDGSRTLLGRALLLLWVVNLGALFAFCAWIFTDSQFPVAAHVIGIRLRSTFQDWPPIISPAALGVSGLILVGGGAVSMISLLAIFASLFFGTIEHRRLRSWLAFMAIVAAWLSLLGTWRELSWRGQQWRAARQIEAFAPLAESLREHWPTEDGVHPALGPFMAYPRDNPRLLLLLGNAQLRYASVPFSAIERSTAGVIRFELGGGELGSWLEWHPPGSMPESFIGGLEGRYDLDRYAPVGGGWFLARYN